MEYLRLKYGHGNMVREQTRYCFSVLELAMDNMAMTMSILIIEKICFSTLYISG